MAEVRIHPLVSPAPSVTPRTVGGSVGPTAVAGVAASVVRAKTGQPDAGWFDIWHMHQHAAREIARDYVRELTLAVD